MGPLSGPLTLQGRLPSMVAYGDPSRPSTRQTAAWRRPAEKVHKPYELNGRRSLDMTATMRKGVKDRPIEQDEANASRVEVT